MQYLYYRQYIYQNQFENNKNRSNTFNNNFILAADVTNIKLDNITML